MRDEAEADLVVDTLLSAIEPETSATGSLEVEGAWLAEAFYVEEPGEDDLRRALSYAMPERSGELELRVEVLADRDWVKESLEAMPPVAAGRFVVYGGHDRERITANRIGIEIEAAQAFGTGHHGTTWGCLFALDALLKRMRFDNPIDIGTGTGVLAIGLAKVLRKPVLATDIDPVAVRITRENARLNGVGDLIAARAADGVHDQAIASGAPYDLIVANILAKPLVALAPGVRAIAAPGAMVVLSGLLTWQRREVEAAWRAQGFVMVSRIARDGWATLVLQRRP